MLKVALAYVTVRLGDTDRARELASEALEEFGPLSSAVGPSRVTAARWPSTAPR